MKRFLCLGAVLFLAILWASCGDVFRPIIIPNPPQFPNPAASHSVVTISNNGILNNAPPPVEIPSQGSAMVIDVSGDSVSIIKTVDLNPVYAVMQSATQGLVVNQAVTGSLPPFLPPPPTGCSVTSGNETFNVCPSLTKLFFSGTTIGSTTSITLPPSSGANFVATTESGQAYVLLPQYTNPATGTVVPSVAVLNTTNNAPFLFVPVGNNPVAMAETPDQTKLYVANEGDNTISAFNTKPVLAARPICDSTGTVCPPTLKSPPIWISARSDSQRVFVLEENGTLAYIDTHTTAGPDNVYESYSPQTVQVSGAAYMWYDVILNRLYVPQGSQKQITVVDASQSTPVVLGSGPIAISTFAPGSRPSSDICATTSAGPLSVVAATSLPDGSRAYVGAFYVDNRDNLCSQVTVITTSSNTIETTIPIPGFPDATNPNTQYYSPVCATTPFRWSMAAGGDSTRAYLASCDGGNVNIIATANDTYWETVAAPISVRNPITGQQLNPPQSPVFLFAGP